MYVVTQDVAHTKVVSLLGVVTQQSPCLAVHELMVNGETSPSPVQD
jgi:hypothetical protein